jgi:hypothetical protein
MKSETNQHEIKLIKHGVILFYDRAFLTFNPSLVEITTQGGEVAFKYAPNEIKRVLFNPSSGIFTIKARSGQKVNIAYKDYSSAETLRFEELFRAYLKEQGVKGWVIGYYQFGKL